MERKSVISRREPASTTAGDRLERHGQLRLLTAFDALLREGTVSRAAASMGLQPPAMSRILSQLRSLYGDPLFIRTGHGLLPTPFAETMRLRVRALTAEADDLMQPGMHPAGMVQPQQSLGWDKPSLLKIPPLALRPSVMIEGQPTPADFAAKLALIGHNAPPERRLAKYIATIGRGPGQSRPLNQNEAADALAIILDGACDPVQVGALLAMVQYRGMTAAEVAGFVEAARRHIGAAPNMENLADIDWPCYISPKLKRAPWFIHSARLVVMAGHSVVLHGDHGQGEDSGKLEMACERAAIPVCQTLHEARTAMKREGIAYLPLAAMSAQIKRLVGLYPLLEMRLPLSTVVHLLNPLGARLSLLGVTKPSHRELHREAAKLAGMDNICIIGSNRDFAEFTPFRSTTLFRLIDGEPADTIIPMRPTPPTQTPTGFSSREYWEAVWTGAARDEVAETTIITTAAAALMSLRKGTATSFDAICKEAAALWETRSKRPS